MINDEDIKELIPEIDCSKNKEVFNTWSITRYIKLIEKGKEKGITFSCFKQINDFFIEDIRLKRKILKYIFYVENKLGAELVTYLIKEKENDQKILNEKKEFVCLENEKEEDKFNHKIEKFNKKLKKFEFDHLYELPDQLSFSERIKLMKLLNFYFRNKKLPNKFWTIFDYKDLFIFSELRNRIVHHEFIILEQKEIENVIEKIGLYVDQKYRYEYNSVSKEINEIWKTLGLI